MSKEKFIQIAQSQLGVREATGHNDGVDVEKYLKSVGLGKGFAWCMAYVYWCAQQAYGDENQLAKTAGVLDQWNKRPELRVAVPEPGDIGIMDFGGGKGHCCIVLQVLDDGRAVKTNEGNTNEAGSREGLYVMNRVRNVKDFKGFLRFK